jgi:hypothetical protein
MRKTLAKVAPRIVLDWRQKWRDFRVRSAMPPFARALIARDEKLQMLDDRGTAACIQETTDWLLRAQESSASSDGGVARHFGLVDGWSASYPETTGYIVPTLIDEGIITGNPHLLESARRMLDWLVLIQFPDGGIQGGVIGEQPHVPVTFNTGQVLIGLAAGAKYFKDARYLEATHKAARWLRDSQDDDGCWRRFSTPFAKQGDKAYETHVSWGLFEAARLDPTQGYGEAGLRQVNWALSCQHANGWFEKCCLSDNDKPLTHTIGYVLRGVIEAYRLEGSKALLEACERTARPLIECMDQAGRLPARLDSRWQTAASYVCLTGTSQISICWLMLYELTGDEAYRAASRRANRFVRRTIATGIHPGVDGAVRGSFPISGNYGRHQFLNWAAKFTIDANRKELALG